MTKNATTASDPASGIRAQWDAAAEGWDAHTTIIRSWLREPTELMFAMAGVDTGYTVLDVAAGAGAQTLDIAARVGPGGRVVATDISAGLIERLRVNARQAGASNIEARVADAQDPLPETEVFEAAVCRMGLMLMPNPGRAVAATMAALKPGAAFCAMVFGSPEENPCVRVLMATALRHSGQTPGDPYAPGSLFSLGRPGALEALFRDAGLQEVVSTKLEAPFRLPSAKDYIAFARASAAPVQAVLQRVAPPERELAWTEMEKSLAMFSGPKGWEGPNTLLLVAGRR